MLWTQAAMVCLFPSATLVLNEDSVYLPIPWKAGDKLEYEIVKAGRETQDGRVTFEATTRTDLEIEVLSAAEEGYLVAWKQGETRFDDPRQAANPVVRRMSNFLQGVQILLELDSRGALVGVRNWKEIKEMFERFLATLTEELKRAGMDAALMDKLKAQAASMFATRKQTEAMCTCEARIFLLVLGGSYSASEPMEYEDLLPNPFGGEPFPSQGAFALKKVDRESGRAVITWRQTIVPEEARRILEKSVRKMGTQLGRPAPEGELLKSLTIEDSAECVVDLSSGWLERLTRRSVIKTGNGAREDVLTITRKREETPSADHPGC